MGIAPRPGAGLTHASASLETSYGKVASSWRLDARRFVLAVTVPPNTMADVTLWETTPERVVGLAGVREVQRRGPDVVVTVGSGEYEFTVSR